MTSRIDSVLQAAVDAGDVPNVVAMAADADGPIYEGAAGPRAVGESDAATPDTLFRIASMTKMVTTTAALQLLERGKLDLDAPVEQYRPEFADLQVLEGFDGDSPRLRPPATKATVRHLGRRARRDAPRRGIGEFDFPATIASADPGSTDDFNPGPGHKWGLGLLLNTEQQPGMRAAGSGAWTGLINTHFWVDRASGVTGAVYTQTLPFLEPRVFQVYGDFEQALYASIDAGSVRSRRFERVPEEAKQKA